MTRPAMLIKNSSPPSTVDPLRREAELLLRLAQGALDRRLPRLHPPAGKADLSRLVTQRPGAHLHHQRLPRHQHQHRAGRQVWHRARVRLGAQLPLQTGPIHPISSSSCHAAVKKVFLTAFRANASICASLQSSHAPRALCRRRWQLGRAHGFLFQKSAHSSDYQYFWPGQGESPRRGERRPPGGYMPVPKMNWTLFGSSSQTR